MAAAADAAAHKYPVCLGSGNPYKPGARVILT
jgi:hypothetical protein